MSWDCLREDLYEDISSYITETIESARNDWKYHLETGKRGQIREKLELSRKGHESQDNITAILMGQHFCDVDKRYSKKVQENISIAQRYWEWFIEGPKIS